MWLDNGQHATFSSHVFPSARTDIQTKKQLYTSHRCKSHTLVENRDFCLPHQPRLEDTYVAYAFYFWSIRTYASQTYSILAHVNKNRIRCNYKMVLWLSGRTLVFNRRAFAVLRSTNNWRVTTYVGKPSAVGQPTRPTQPFILSGSISWCKLQLDVVTTDPWRRHLVNANEG